MTFNLFTQAFREVEVAFSASVAVVSSVIVFAWTLTSTYFTDTVSSAVDVAVAGTALRISIITETALVAVWRKELRATFTLAATFRAVSSGIIVITLTCCNTKVQVGQILLFKTRY